MKRVLRLVVLALVIVVATSSTARPEPTDTLKTFMRKKLDHSQKVLEGLTTGNFELISKNAQSMSLLSQAETWQVLQTAEYLERSVEFRRSVDALMDASKKKNLEGAALAYMDATLKCVNCHKYIREVKMADGRPLAERLVANP